MRPLALAGMVVSISWLTFALAVGAAEGEPPALLSPEAAVAKLSEGGLVIAFRHTARDSDHTPFEADRTGACVPGSELTEQGKQDAADLRKVLAKRAIPVGPVHVSPTCRTREMAEIMFGDGVAEAPELLPPLVKQGGNPLADWEAAGDAMRRLLAEPPPEGQNRVLLGHSRTLWLVDIRRLPTGKATLAEGAAAVLARDDAGTLSVIAVLDLDDWRRLGDIETPAAE